MPIPWFDWIERLSLYREAQRRFTVAAPPDEPRLATIKRRAFSSIGRKQFPIPRDRAWFATFGSLRGCKS